jgi:hypothetical protein
MSGQTPFADFLQSAAADPAPPAELSRALAALWHDRRGEWDVAHVLAQEAAGKDGSWVHAYLHRKEGDEVNARYWYRLAGRPIGAGALEAEWEQIVRALLDGKE